MGLSTFAFSQEQDLKGKVVLYKSWLGKSRIGKVVGQRNDKLAIFGNIGVNNSGSTVTAKRSIQDVSVEVNECIDNICPGQRIRFGLRGQKTGQVKRVFKNKKILVFGGNGWGQRNYILNTSDVFFNNLNETSYI